MNQKRWKSQTALNSMIALFVLVVKAYLGYTVPRIDVLVVLAIVAVIVYGIYNNPTDRIQY